MMEASETQKPLTVKTFTFMPNAQAFTDQLLIEFLKDHKLDHLYDALSYCIRELAINAKKANTKRIFFQENNLDPKKSEDYELGMKTFKESMLKHQIHYLNKLKENSLYIKIEFLRYQSWASFAVKNNTEMLPEEWERIRMKIAQAKEYESLEDAFVEVMDDLEGAGLGLVVLILLMRNSGISGDFLHIYPKPGETVARIIVPLTD